MSIYNNYTISTVDCVISYLLFFFPSADDPLMISSIMVLIILALLLCVAVLTLLILLIICLFRHRRRKQLTSEGRINQNFIPNTNPSRDYITTGNAEPDYASPADALKNIPQNIKNLKLRGNTHNSIRTEESRGVKSNQGMETLYDTPINAILLSNMEHSKTDHDDVVIKPKSIGHNMAEYDQVVMRPNGSFSLGVDLKAKSKADLGSSQQHLL